MAVEHCTVLRQLDARSLQEHLDLTRALDNCSREDITPAESPAEDSFCMRGLYELIPGADAAPLPMRTRNQW